MTTAAFASGAPAGRAANGVTLPLSGFAPQHFRLEVQGPVATVTLNRPEKKNPLTFESYRELTDFFWACRKDEGVKAIVIAGAGGNFSSGATCSRSSARWSRWTPGASRRSPA
jgi:enoyl-CoA hydratase/carnithine racemase